MGTDYELHIWHKKMYTFQVIYDFKFEWQHWNADVFYERSHMPYQFSIERFLWYNVLDTALNSGVKRTPVSTNNSPKQLASLIWILCAIQCHFPILMQGNKTIHNIQYKLVYKMEQSHLFIGFGYFIHIWRNNKNQNKRNW